MKKYPKLRMNEKAALKTLKEILSTRFNLLDLRIFGSKIKGYDTAQSDIDVMIELDEYNPGIRQAIHDIIFEINLENEAFISPTIFSKKEIEDGPLSESPIYKTIIREGIPV